MEVDLTNCDREPIHLLGHVQSFGCLLVVSSDWLITHASCNTDMFLGVKAEDLIGTAIRDLISPEALHSIRGQIQTLHDKDAIGRVYAIELRDGHDDRFNVAVHLSSETSTVIEFERAAQGGEQNDQLSQVRGMIDRLQNAEDVSQLCSIAARFVRAMCGFDRVMVYKFAPDDTGEVIAEAINGSYDSFMGLRYPASDIPKQARALYKRSLIRIISDVDGEVSPIIPETGPDGAAVDLSLSTLRAVSPIHLEYLRNMGISASMSISILLDGKLWGLFACHNHSPRYLDYRVRTSCDLFGQMFSFVLSQVVSRNRTLDAERARGLHNTLMRQFAEGGSIVDDFDTIVDGLGKLIPFDGAVGWIDGSFRSRGDAPGREDIMELVRFLNTTAPSSIYSTDCLQRAFPPAESYAKIASGLMALPVSRSPRDYIILFRGEFARTVKWAGNPEKPVELGPNGARLTPRKSFEEWQEDVSGHSKPWTDAEREVAEAIRVTLLEVVLRLSDAANMERSKSQQKQELLIAELNHRVRNILNLIRGLVDQSKAGPTSIADFTSTVSARIHALARAHDQITQEAWNAASLRQLLMNELEAYVGPKQARVSFSGPDAIIKPEAITTLALVIHELATNSAKYGSLADSTGNLDIRMEQTDTDGLVLHWEERDGPPVQAPIRRGFGSTVIERSIPFELGGKVDVEYALSGLKARLEIPARHIEQFVEADGQAEDHDDGVVTGPAEKPELLSGVMLLVEDNLIIAMDAEKHLLGLGASQVHIAGNVDQALQVVADTPIVFAVLDLNLGPQTSLPVARELTKQGVPFVFATGYGDASDLLKDFREVPVVTKPYSSDSLHVAAMRALGKS